MLSIEHENMRVRRHGKINETHRSSFLQKTHLLLGKITHFRLLTTSSPDLTDFTWLTFIKEGIPFDFCLDMLAS